MYDKYILLEDKYDATACGYVQNGYENFLGFKLKGSSATNYYMPNPFVDDAQYIPDRNAFSNTSTLAQASISLIRNTDNVAFFITNADTGEVYATVDRGLAPGLITPPAASFLEQRGDQPCPQLVCHRRRRTEAAGGNRVSV